MRVAELEIEVDVERDCSWVDEVSARAFYRARSDGELSVALKEHEHPSAIGFAPFPSAEQPFRRVVIATAEKQRRTKCNHAQIHRGVNMAHGSGSRERSIGVRADHSSMAILSGGISNWCSAVISKVISKRFLARLGARGRPSARDLRSRRWRKHFDHQRGSRPRAFTQIDTLAPVLHSAGGPQSDVAEVTL